MLFCDDLSFAQDDQHYKALKAVLDGGIEGRPDNVILYATSNRRHLMPRDMIENERSTAISPSEAVEEKVSLSDRFGHWLGFHPCDQGTYLAMIEGYCGAWGLPWNEAVRAEAIAWAAGRGARSGRVAWQFVTDLAGRRGGGDGGGSEGGRVSGTERLPHRPDEGVDGLWRLGDWLVSKCNGDWGHHGGVTIRSTDDPGWSVSFDLNDETGGLNETVSHLGWHYSDVNRAELVYDADRQALRVFCSPLGIKPGD